MVHPSPTPLTPPPLAESQLGAHPQLLEVLIYENISWKYTNTEIHKNSLYYIYKCITAESIINEEVNKSKYTKVYKYMEL